MILRKKPRVLLLDDDAAMQRLVAALLRRDGYRVDVVGKGNQAIDALGRAKYDAIILDLMMPHEGGMTVIQHLRDKKPELLPRVLVLSATPQAVLKTMRLDLGGVVTKPFQERELLDAVGKLASS